MRNHLFLAGVAVAALMPVIAVAQTTCEQRQTERVVGTVAGAGIGALLGSAIAGHYDTSGRWVAEPATGHYDVRGRWIPGQPTRVTDVQPGYYDQGRWHAEQVTGYYDAQGRWIRVDNSGYRGRGAAPNDINGRSAW